MAELSILVPAHNEADTIVRSLDTLAELGETAEVLVVCNGCTDDTADLVRSHAPWAHVVELEHGSKPAALRAGDAALTVMPRLYLDADVVVTASGIRRLHETLTADDYDAVAPTPRYDIRGAGRLLRSYYRVWTALQSGVNSIYGTGTMLVSERGRRAFGEWPDLLADDYFLDLQFAPERKARVSDVDVVVQMPTSSMGCVSRRARVHEGKRQLLELGVLSAETPDTGNSRSLSELVRAEPRMIVYVPAFLGVTVAARLLSWWRRRRGNATEFHRDLSSRVT